MVKTYTAAQGRWREILIALGVDGKFLTGKPNQPCPLCGGTDRFTFDNRTGQGDYFCRQCGAGKGMLLAMKSTGWEFKRTADEIDRIIHNLPETHHPEFRSPQKKPASVDALRQLWLASNPISDLDPVWRYLHARGLKPNPTLRYVPELKHYETKSVYPGMIAVFSDVDGNPATIHRTFLTRDGRKASLNGKDRMFMPGKVPDGGAIRLFEPAELMGVAEGIETALAASALYSMPVWATTSVNSLMKWQPPVMAKHIQIFGDNDLNYVGQSAAYQLAHRLLLEARRDSIDRTVMVSIPGIAGRDWNDELERGENNEGTA